MLVVLVQSAAIRVSKAVAIRVSNLTELLSINSDWILSTAYLLCAYLKSLYQSEERSDHEKYSCLLKIVYNLAFNINRFRRRLPETKPGTRLACSWERLTEVIVEVEKWLHFLWGLLERLRRAFWGGEIAFGTACGRRPLVQRPPRCAVKRRPFAALT